MIPILLMIPFVWLVITMCLAVWLNAETHDEIKTVAKVGLLITLFLLGLILLFI